MQATFTSDKSKPPFVKWDLKKPQTAAPKAKLLSHGWQPAAWETAPSHSPAPFQGTGLREAAADSRGINKKWLFRVETAVAA